MGNVGQGRDLRRDEGFALVAVIAMGLLFSTVAIVFTSAVRSTIKSAEAQLAMAEAEAAADAGFNLALLDLLKSARSERNHRFSHDGTPSACMLSQSHALTIRVRDEAGRVDINAAREDLLRSLLIGVGVARSEVEAKLSLIADFKDRDSDRRLGGAEAGDYRAQGLPGEPKNAPLDVFEELARVKGFDSALLSRLRPLVTFYSGLDGVDPAAASGELAQILSRGSGLEGEAEDALRPEGEVLPSHYAVASLKNTFSIEVEAATARGATFVREAIVSLSDRPQARRTISEQTSFTASTEPVYRIWRWRRAEMATGVAAADVSSLPPC